MDSRETIDLWADFSSRI